MMANALQEKKKQWVAVFKNTEKKAVKQQHKREWSGL